MKREKGITLIALVITIIILIILAGIGIRMSLGNNGLFNKAKQGKEDYLHAANIEQDEMKNVEESIDNFATGIDHGIDLSKYIKIGEYVDYDPTKTDVNKTQEIDANKIRYVSPKGGYNAEKGIITNGNGNDAQTYVAKPNDGTDNGMRWRVLSISKNSVELISEECVLEELHPNKNFFLQGGIGYLYAEQELNSICSIYGYGYGADTSLKVSYTVGGPEDTPIEGQITGTGARCIKVEDINKLAGVTEQDLPSLSLHSIYGNETNPTTPVYYPTLSSSNTTYPGQSTGKKTGNKINCYEYDKTKIENQVIQDLIFNGNYWLCSRYKDSTSTEAWYGARAIYNGKVYYNGIAVGLTNRLNQPTPGCFIRPVVTLKSNVINIDDTSENIGTATNPWKLK